MRRRRTEQIPSLPITALAFVLIALPLAAQPTGRTDCLSEEITGIGFFTICGGDRDTLSAFRERIDTAQRRLAGRAFTEALRSIACDTQSLDGDLRHLIDNTLGYAAATA